MENNQIKRTIRVYLRFPIYMMIPIIIGVFVLCLYDRALIVPATLIVGIYALASIIIYLLFYQKFTKAIVGVAANLDSAQKDYIENLPIPYAIINKEGRILWKNEIFKKLARENDGRTNYISDILTDINKNILKKLSGEKTKLSIKKDERIYNVDISPLSKERPDETDFSWYGVILWDVTEVEKYKTRLEDDKLVVSNVYIDNYEEAIESVEDVKQSLLKAVIDRKIQKYFGEVDGIIKKMEKDKYFVVFPKRFLGKLKEDKLSILEDVASTKVGNENDITLSIGMGVGADSFTKTAEYSKVATNLALGRGGSQAVVKEGGEINIFGVKGKEVETNTRVKARVKAQTLRELMLNRDRVIVMGHKMSDYDCLGAAMGIYITARDISRRCHIVLDNVTSSLRPVLETITGNEIYPDDLIISKDEALAIAGSNTLVIVVDTNSKGYTECPELLEKTKDIVVIDHHRQGNDTIQNPILSYIETYASSTCEMIAEIVQYFSEDIEVTPTEADCIYAGMLIDTNNFMAKTGVRTFEAAAYLRRNGADVTRVRKLLREDINAYKARAEIVRNAEVYKNYFAISKCEPKGIESPTVVGAQAANELLNIVGIKASFVLTSFDEKIYVSSRSIDEIDVQEIMERIGGGGHLHIAGAQVSDSSIEEVKIRIHDILDEMLDKGEIK